MCPWTLARSWEHLSTCFSFLLFPFFLFSFFPSLSFFLSFFLSFSLSLFLSFSLSLSRSLSLSLFLFLFFPFLLAWSLDAFVIAGSPSSLSRSWEHHSLLLFSSFLSPLLSRARHAYKQTRLLQSFSMRFGLSSVCLLSLGSLFIGPTDVFSFFPFMSFCFHVSSSSSFFSLACAFARPLACTHTCARAYSILN